MPSTLVIVESPAKAKTIKKYLPKGYEVKATMGHVIDLPKSRLGIDVANHFQPDYIKIRGKGDLLKKLKKEAKKADNVLLATDPDREGEAISWHVANFLKMDPADSCRIEFHEITKKAINAAIDNKRQVDMDLVNSQQARRILDRLVGYSLSPFLWKKVKKGLSGGRVQSVVTRIIVDREKEIQAFVPEEYWTIDADLKKQKDKAVFTASLHSEKGKKLKISNGIEADRLEALLKGEGEFVVSGVKKRVRKQKPQMPFTTSTLQQMAYQALGFTTQRTMCIAQQLYEGVDIMGRGQIGLVSYIRTDSTRLADEAVAAAKDYIETQFGKEYLGGGKSAVKKKNVQDAHEAIRPSTIDLTPDSIASSLEKDQYKLYKLIWERMIASQMSEAEYYVTDVDILFGVLLFKAKGETIKFKGFTEIMESKSKKDNILPELSEGKVLDLKKLHKDQKFTKPPARYTEATLVKVLEEKGIGRPSTYAPTISTIKNRDYVEVKEKYFYPTELGVVVTDLMKEYFADIVDEAFTAKMEESLDEVATGGENWIDLLDKFYSGFKGELENAQENAQSVKVEDPESDEICELCGRRMVIKKGKYGKFLACPGFPECKNTKPFLEKTGGICPDCGGDIIKRVSKKGRTFYACSNYPECEFVTWDVPVVEKCPVCGNTMFQKGFGKRKRTYCAKCSGNEAK
ncbi:type I DNA topoisomerase [Eubacterium aggregans]|uniref:type I DNA topoisomerase n=1 Tax=Eubacterium aggregans TaxID=81409 RepID=UPI003F3930DD